MVPTRQDAGLAGGARLDIAVAEKKMIRIP